LTLPVVVRTEAEQDLREAAIAFESIRLGLGKEFLRNVREVLDRLESQPEISGFVWGDVRAALVRRFRFIIYHVTFADRVEILAVLHGMRDAETWRSRV